MPCSIDTERKENEMQNDHLSLNAVARLLGVKPYRISYALAVGYVEEPALRIAGNRVFQSEDIQRLVEYFSDARSDKRVNKWPFDQDNGKKKNDAH